MKTATQHHVGNILVLGTNSYIKQSCLQVKTIIRTRRQLRYIKHQPVCFVNETIDVRGSRMRRR